MSPEEVARAKLLAEWVKEAERGAHAGEPGFWLGCAVTEYLHALGLVRLAKPTGVGRDLLDRARKAGVL